MHVKAQSLVGRADELGFVCLCVLGSSLHRPVSSFGNVEHVVILNSTVLRRPCNGYNNHLTNNLEQALIASNVVLRLGYGESRDMLTVKTLL